MAATKRRTRARIEGDALAASAVRELGRSVRAARSRRGLTQDAIAERVGISRQRLGGIEAGAGLGVPAGDWFAIAKALGIYLRFEFGRDPQQELRDATHPDIQTLVVRVGARVGWKAEWESRSGLRSIDVRLEDRQWRRIAIVECWNTIGDLGAAIRSSDHKVREAEQRAAATAGGGAPFGVGLLWVVRDTKANRGLLTRYAALIGSRFPGSSVAWVKALAAGAAMPTQPAIIWCDLKATRLFARRG